MIKTIMIPKRRKIVQKDDSYEIQEVMDDDGWIHWQIFDSYGMLSEHNIAEDAMKRIRELIQTSDSGSAPM